MLRRRYDASTPQTSVLLDLIVSKTVGRLSLMTRTPRSTPPT